MKRSLLDKQYPFPTYSTVGRHLNSAIRLVFEYLHYWLAVWPMSSSSVWTDWEFLRETYKFMGCLATCFCISCDISKIVFLCSSLYFSASFVPHLLSPLFLLVKVSPIIHSTLLRFISQLRSILLLILLLALFPKICLGCRLREHTLFSSHIFLKT